MSIQSSSQRLAVPTHNNLDAVTFAATSAEQYVLCVQTYRLARMVLRDNLARGAYCRPAVVMDLDETVLDNIAYNAWLIETGRNYHSSHWDAWCNASAAAAVPGALGFIRFARLIGVTPIFITSRNNATRVSTAKNLNDLGVMDSAAYELEKKAPTGDASATSLFMAKMTAVSVDSPRGIITHRLSNKFEQRAFAEQVRGYEIVLSVGDNLSDYAEYYGSRSVTKPDGTEGTGIPRPLERRLSAEQDRGLFGDDFILIPNAVYGGWLRAFTANNRGDPSELCYSDGQVRGAFQQPQGEHCCNGKPVTTAGPRFPSGEFPQWDGPASVA